MGTYSSFCLGFTSVKFGSQSPIHSIKYPNITVTKFYLQTLIFLSKSVQQYNDNFSTANNYRIGNTVVKVSYDQHYMKYIVHYIIN